MDIFQILKRPAPITASSDETAVESTYRYWRWRIFFGMYIGYVFYYFSRNSYGSLKPLLIQEGYQVSDLGVLVSVFALSYGWS